LRDTLQKYGSIRSLQGLREAFRHELGLDMAVAIMEALRRGDDAEVVAQLQSALSLGTEPGDASKRSECSGGEPGGGR
jgi:hypothetical protein